jgi:hypothetical protein
MQNLRQSTSDHDILPAERSSSEPGSSVSIVSDYGLDDQAIEFRSPAEAKEFFL